MVKVTSLQRPIKSINFFKTNKINKTIFPISMINKMASDHDQVGLIPRIKVKWYKKYSISISKFQ